MNNNEIILKELMQLEKRELVALVRKMAAYSISGHPALDAQLQSYRDALARYEAARNERVAREKMAKQREVEARRARSREEKERAAWEKELERRKRRPGILAQVAGMLLRKIR